MGRRPSRQRRPSTETRALASADRSLTLATLRCLRLRLSAGWECTGPAKAALGSTESRRLSPCVADLRLLLTTLFRVGRIFLL
jgi:hypothetical protein